MDPDLSGWIAQSLGRADLAPLSDSDIELLAQHLTEAHYAGGQTVFREGEETARVHVVRSGRIKLTRTVTNRTASLQILGPGDIFGDIPVLLRLPEPVTARALEDSVVMSIPPAALYRLLERHSRIARRWLVSLASRAATSQDRISELLAPRVDGRLAAFLLHQTGGEIVLSQAHIGEAIGAQRTTVNQVLKQFESSGLVELGYRRVTVVDADRLGELV